MPSAQPDSFKLKFKHDIPLLLEHALIHVHGFTYFARKKDEWVIYQKFIDRKQPDFSGLADDVVAELARKVNRIASSFEDPDAHKDIIKIRCTNLARTLLPRQRAWVMDWIKRVIDEEDPTDEDCETHPHDDDPPWEDENYCPNLGFC